MGRVRSKRWGGEFPGELNALSHLFFHIAGPVLAALRVVTEKILKGPAKPEQVRRIVKPFHGNLVPGDEAKVLVEGAQSLTHGVKDRLQKG